MRKDKRTRNVSPRLALLTLSIIWVSSAVNADVLRVASLNLCTDSMLFELAEPAQIVSVTTLSRDEHISLFAERAKGYTVNQGLAEEIILTDPDLILAGRYTASATSALLARLGYNVMVFDPVFTVADFRASFLRLADAIDARHRATQLLQRMDDALRSIQIPTDTARPLAIVYRPNGFSPGSRSLAHEMLQAAGVDNLAAALGIASGGFVALERLVAAQPDIVIMGNPNDAYPALAELVLKHPALSSPATNRARAKPMKHVRIPAKYWTCGGTYLADAAQRIAASRN